MFIFNKNLAPPATDESNADYSPTAIPQHAPDTFDPRQTEEPVLVRQGTSLIYQGPSPDGSGYIGAGLTLAPVPKSNPSVPPNMNGPWESCGGWSQNDSVYNGEPAVKHFAAASHAFDEVVPGSSNGGRRTPPSRTFEDEEFEWAFSNVQRF